MFKYFKFVLFLTVLAFSSPTFSQENQVNYDCAFEKERIISDLKKDVTCTHDEECGWFDYGYPWQPSACSKAIINTKQENHNITNLRLIEEYNNYCLYNNADEKKKYDDFSSGLQKANCEIPRAYCYKGFCRTKNYAIYNDK